MNASAVRRGQPNTYTRFETKRASTIGECGTTRDNANIIDTYELSRGVSSPLVAIVMGGDGVSSTPGWCVMRRTVSPPSCSVIWESEVDRVGARFHWFHSVLRRCAVYIVPGCSLNRRAGFELWTRRCATRTSTVAFQVNRRACHGLIADLKFDTCMAGRQ